MSEDILQQLCVAADSFFHRGYAFGSTGNLSVRFGGQVWITPTGARLAGLRPDQLASMGRTGISLNSNKPSKEYPFHLAAYDAAADRAAAIVHLHSTYSVALSCLADLDERNPLPFITPYYLMRVAPLAVLPYLRPGSNELAAAVGKAARDHDCMLLRNHGLICMGATIEEAVDRAEELEETAKLSFVLRGERLRELTKAQVKEIEDVFRRGAKFR
jgi:ribulose-5-phosphate 4-epimerase/fuculose-1-phosphate aldolase